MKVLLAEYLNYVDMQNKPVGHGKKVFEEAFRLLENNCEVEVAVSDAYWNNEDRSIKLSEICQNKVGKKLGSKIRVNIESVFKNKDADIIWFTNIEWRLLVYLAFITKKRKVCITCYRDMLNDAKSSRSKLKIIKVWLVNRGLKRANLVIVTNLNLRLSKRQMYIADYVYSETYKKYEVNDKKARVLCVGAMRASKDLRGLVNHFKNTDVQVYIVGGFSDKGEYRWIAENKTDNIIVEDRVLLYDEYYRLIAESEFIVVPYKMEAYIGATSGVLQEAIFLKSIPIAPRALLEYNNINGISYENICELPTNLYGLQARGEKVFNSLDGFEETNVRRKIINAFERITREYTEEKG